MIKLLDSSLRRLGIIRNIISAECREELNGEYVLDFETVLTQELRDNLTPYSAFEINGQYFDLGHITETINDAGQVILKIEADHISYRLNDKEYDLEAFDEETQTGFEDMIGSSPSSVLYRILQGTPFTGTMSVSKHSVDFTVSGTTTRRQALLDLLDMVKGDIIYDNFNISIVDHRGSKNDKVAIVGKNIVDLEKQIDRRTRQRGEEAPPVEEDPKLQIEVQFINVYYDPDDPESPPIPPVVPSEFVSVKFRNHLYSSSSQLPATFRSFMTASAVSEGGNPTEDEDEDPPYIVTYTCNIIEEFGQHIYNLGDDVRLINHDLQIDTTQRVITISYNPDNETEPRSITLGEYDHRKFETSIVDTITDDVVDEIINNPEVIDEVTDGLADAIADDPALVDKIVDGLVDDILDDPDLIDQITDGLAEQLVDGPQGEKGDPGDPGPQGPQGPEGELSEEVRSRIQNEDDSVSVECGMNFITLSQGSNSYDLNLVSTDDQGVLKKNGNSLEIGPLNVLSSGETKIECMADTINLKIDDANYNLKFVPPPGETELKDGYVLTRQGTDLRFTNTLGTGMTSQASIWVGTELPPLDQAAPGILYLIVD